MAALILFRFAPAALILGLTGSCCLTRPADAKTLITAGNDGWRTPEAAFETFRAAFSVDLPELEYRTFSRGFRERERLSYQTYRVARQKLIESYPLLGLLTKARIVDSRELADGSGLRLHRLVVQAAGRRFVVDLVREDGYQIYAGGDLIADGPVDFAASVHVHDVPGGNKVIAELVLPAQDPGDVDLSKLSSLRLEQTWKFDVFFREDRAP